MGIRSGKGDKGVTDLYFTKRISKDSMDIRAIGNLDELNSFLGLIKSKTRLKKDKAVIEKIQHAVSTIASEIAVGVEKKNKLGLLFRKEDTDWIKTIILDLEQGVKIESCFCLPGDNELSAFLDVARTVARRTERSVVGLFKKDKVKNYEILSYLNCISDVLFIMSRKAAQKKPKRKVTRKIRKKTKNTTRKR